MYIHIWRGENEWMWRNIEWTNKPPPANKCKFLYHFHAVRFHVSVFVYVCVFASMSVDRWYYFCNTFINQVREFVNISTKKKAMFVAMSGSLSRSINWLNWKCGIRVRVIVDVIRSCYFMLKLFASMTGWSVCTLYSIQFNWSFFKFSFFNFHLNVTLFVASSFAILARSAKLRKNSNLMRASRTNQNAHILKSQFNSHIHPFSIHVDFWA